jgi:Ohr subfamily peroxiredoxin
MSQTATARKPDKVLYTAKLHTAGGRDHGTSRSSDANLDIKLSPPGSGRPGTNPEQLFAAGWSACFESAIREVVRSRKIAVPDASIDAEVDLNFGESGYFLSARLKVSLPGIDRETAESIIEDAHKTCPYSKAVHGNIKVVTTLV